MMTSRARIFVIGFNRCGTHSFDQFFKKAGLRSCHWDGGRLAVAMARNAEQGRPLMAGYEEYDAFSEMHYSCFHGTWESNQYFRDLAQQEPDAKFILNVRDVDRWLRSRSYWHKNGLVPFPATYRPTSATCSPPHCEMEYVDAYMKHHGFQTQGEVCDYWRALWTNHLEAVQNYLPPERLLVFDIEKDDPIALSRFLSLPEDTARGWSHEHKSLHTPTSSVVIRAVPRRLKRLTPRPIKNMLRNFLIAIENRLRTP